MDIHSLMGRASTMMSGKRNDDSMSDRLNYRYTVAILVIFAIINMNRLYTDQIKCWVNRNYLYLIKNICLLLTNSSSVYNRFQHFLHQIMMNTFDQYVLFRTLIMSNTLIKSLSHRILKNRVKFCIINGFHFFY